MPLLDFGQCLLAASIFKLNLLTEIRKRIWELAILQVADAEEIAMLSGQLCSKFLFSVGLHTKKTLRGTATEWYDALQVRGYIMFSNAKEWNMLLYHPQILTFLLAKLNSHSPWVMFSLWFKRFVTIHICCYRYTWELQFTPVPGSLNMCCLPSLTASWNTSLSVLHRK